MTTSLSPRLQYVVVAVGVVAVALAGYLLLVAPKRSEAARLDRELETLRTTAARPEPEPQTNDELVELFLLAKAMPDKTDMPGLVLDLDRLAGSSGVELLSLAPQAAVAGQGFESLPLQAVLNGDYASISRFLRRLRERVGLRGGRVHLDGRLYTVGTLDLAGSEGGGLRATLTLNAYRFAAGDTGAQAAPTTPPAGEAAP